MSLLANVFCNTLNEYKLIFADELCCNEEIIPNTSISDELSCHEETILNNSNIAYVSLTIIKSSTLVYNFLYDMYLYCIFFMKIYIVYYYIFCGNNLVFYFII